MSRLLAVKLRRDLRAVWPRLALMTVAIAVCLTAFGAVLFAWSAGRRETAAAYASAEPASATILFDTQLAAERMARIAAEARTQPGVTEATGRTQFHAEVEVNGQPRRIPLQVFVAAPDDPRRVAKFFVRQGSWPGVPGELFVGKDSLDLLGVAVGDTVTVTKPGGARTTLRVAGTVYDPSLSPSPQEQTARAYLADGALPLDELKLKVLPGNDREQIIAVAGRVGEWLQREYGVTIREIQVPRPNAHPHQWQADALMAALLAGAAASVLLSVLLVATMLGNLFTQQTPQIGIMKATGARPRHVAGLYLSMTLLVAAAATVLAIGPAILLGRLAVGTFLRLLGIEAASLAAPAWSVTVMLAAGLLLPPLMTLLPLVRASRITVRAAIDHHGGPASPGRMSALVARLSRFSGFSRFDGLDRGLLMALRNTVRRPGRFWLSAGLLAAAGAVLMAGMSLSDSTAAIAQEQERQRTWDVDVQLAQPATMEKVAVVVSGVPGVRVVDGFGVVSAGLAGPGRIPVTRTYPDQGHGRVGVTAIADAAPTFGTPKLLEGRWLRSGETGALVINQIVRENSLPGARAGDTVQLILGGRPTTWRIAGIVEERMGGAGGVYTTTAGLAAATGQSPRVTQLRVVIDRHDEPARRAAADTIEQSLTQQGIPVASSESVSRRQSISEGHLGPVVLILLGIALPLGVVGMIGLASTMSANVLDRIREFGVMHAIGARPKAVRRVVVAEGVFLAAASCLIALVPALLLTSALGSGLGNLFFSAPLPYRFSPAAAAVWFALAILGTVLACQTAASRAARLTVREALTHL